MACEAIAFYLFGRLSSQILSMSELRVGEQHSGAMLAIVPLHQSGVVQWVQGVPRRPILGAGGALLPAASQLHAQCCRV